MRKVVVGIVVLVLGVVVSTPVAAQVWVPGIIRPYQEPDPYSAPYYYGPKPGNTWVDRWNQQMRRQNDRAFQQQLQEQQQRWQYQQTCSRYDPNCMRNFDWR